MRYSGPKCRLCRREGVKLFLKGERCFTDKCPATTTPPPGMHGKRAAKMSEYGKQLREKQKAKRYFGITERVMINLHRKAVVKAGNQGDNLMLSLKMRFDNLLYESGLVTSRNTARQLINHGLFMVNKRRADIPSMELKVGDAVTFKKTAKKEALFGHLEKSKFQPPRWLKVDTKNVGFEVIDMPESKDLVMEIADPQQIIESYSR